MDPGSWAPNTVQDKRQVSGRRVEYVQAIPRERNKVGREENRLCWRSQTKLGGGGAVRSLIASQEGSDKKDSVDRNVQEMRRARRARGMRWLQH